jgi:hypothetical protein
MASSYYTLDVKNSTSQQATACNRSTTAMGGVSWRGENKEVPRPTTIAWLKIEKFFDGKKSNQERKGRFLWLF